MDEAGFRRIISGDDRRVRASLARCGLRMLSPLYGAGVRVRNLAFDCRLRTTHRVPAPVVSVGNLTTGGTGKTPAVAWLVGWFQKRGLRVAILSRGYRSLPPKTQADGSLSHRRDSRPPMSRRLASPEANDEKLVLDALCPGVPHLQGTDRARLARTAVEEFGAEILLLDDGFQHRRLARDLDIVLVDALQPWGYGHLLPRGLLREPLSAFKRADLIVLTRADQCSATEKQKIIDRLRCLSPDCRHVEIAFDPECLVSRDGRTEARDAIKDRKVAAFCGIGNPEGFRKTLADCGCVIADGGFRTFPDHHRYGPDDLADLDRWAKAREAETVLTTQKDLVKIDRAEIGGRPLRALRTGMRVMAGREVLEARLAATERDRPN